MSWHQSISEKCGTAPPGRASGISSPKLWGLWIVVWIALAVALINLTGPARTGQEVIGWRVLTEGVLAGQDTIVHDYPATWWGWSEIRRAGRLPLWNPCWFGGIPFVASQTFMAFYPPGWLGAILPFPLAFNIQYPLHLILAAWVMAWACRRRGFGILAAGLAGIGWGFGGHLATLAGPGHIQKLQALAWLPMVTLGSSEIARGRMRRGVWPLTIGLALQITAGHLQIVYLALATAMLEALAIIISSKSRVASCELRVPRIKSRAGWLAIGFAGAIALSAVFWIPTVEFARLSNRQGALEWDDATRGSLPPEEAFEFVLPRLRGDSMPRGRGSYWGRYGESPTSAPERVVSDYVGAGVLLFALWGLIVRGARRREAWGWTTLAATALVLSMGKYIPWLYRPAFAFIPGLSHFRSPSTMMALLAYGLTMASAVGVDAFFRAPEQIENNQNRKRLFRYQSLAFLVIAILASFITFECILLVRGGFQDPTNITSGNHDQIGNMLNAINDLAIFTIILAFFLFL